MSELAQDFDLDPEQELGVPFHYEEDTRHLHITFYMKKPERNKRKSIEAGRPIFEAKEMVRIRIVGDPKRIHCAPADEESLKVPDPAGNSIALTYKQRWPKHYEAFKK